jgi:hypothetical protein
MRVHTTGRSNLESSSGLQARKRSLRGKPDPYATPLQRRVDAILLLIIIVVLLVGFWRPSAHGQTASSDGRDSATLLVNMGPASPADSDPIVVSNRGTLLGSTGAIDRNSPATLGAVTLSSNSTVQSESAGWKTEALLPAGSTDLTVGSGILTVHPETDYATFHGVATSSASNYNLTLTPVLEHATWLTAAVALALVGYAQRRLFRRPDRSHG